MECAELHVGILVKKLFSTCFQVVKQTLPFTMVSMHATVLTAVLMILLCNYRLAYTWRKVFEK